MSRDQAFWFQLRWPNAETREKIKFSKGVRHRLGFFPLAAVQVPRSSPFPFCRLYIKERDSLVLKTKHLTICTERNRKC